MKIWLARLGVLVGLVFCLVGVLWFLQGAGLVHIEPVACVANCEQLMGPSVTWQIFGGITVAISVTVIVVYCQYLKRMRAIRKERV